MLHVASPISTTRDHSSYAGPAYIKLEVEWTLPAGTYRPVGETPDGYCYAAPSEVRFSGTHYREAVTAGGIFWKRGLRWPEHIYVGTGQASILPNPAVAALAKPQRDEIPWQDRTFE